MCACLEASRSSVVSRRSSTRRGALLPTQAARATRSRPSRAASRSSSSTSRPPPKRKSSRSSATGSKETTASRRRSQSTRLPSTAASGPLRRGDATVLLTFGTERIASASASCGATRRRSRRLRSRRTGSISRSRHHTRTRRVRKSIRATRYSSAVFSRQRSPLVPKREALTTQPRCGRKGAKARGAQERDLGRAPAGVTRVRRSRRKPPLRSRAPARTRCDQPLSFERPEHVSRVCTRRECDGRGYVGDRSRRAFNLADSGAGVLLDWGHGRPGAAWAFAWRIRFNELRFVGAQ
eukprot:Amastigsp_a692_22.p2 type:complete len:295 gc:universal Amastigsp_a692_22:552-1436(+)